MDGGIPLTRKSDHRGRLIAAVLATAFVAAGCGAPPVHDDSILDARFAGPCERLIVAWQAGAVRPGELGPRLRPRSGEPGSEVELHVVHCPGSRRREAPLLFAYTAVPVDAGSVPLVVTSMPDDGWWAMTELWADADTSEVLSAMGYEVTPAGISLDIEEAAANRVVVAEIDAVAGQFGITAGTPGATEDVDEYRALIVDGDAAVSTFFGPESLSRTGLGSYRVGASTLLESIGMSAEPQRTLLDRQLTSERIYWLLPKSSSAE